MGDSDDEYERRRNRDKFAKERVERRDFSDNRRGSGYNQRPPGMDYMNRRPRQDFSPPVNKRPRRDWGEDTYDPQPRNRDAGAEGGAAGGGGGSSTSGTVLMSFKQFLATQDDSITDEDAIQKYQDYKTEHKRQQLHNFFVAHKDEEWFRLKYQPEDSKKQNEDNLNRLKRRMEVFMELMEEGWVDRASLDHNNGRQLVRLMDALVVKLEGGTKTDLDLLESEDYDSESVADKSTDSATVQPPKVKTPTPAPQVESESNTENEDEKAEIKQEEGAEAEGDGKVQEEGEEPKPKKDGNEEGALSDSDSDKEEPTQSKKITRKKTTSTSSGVQERVKPPVQTMLLHKTASIFLRNLAPSITKSEIETLCSGRFSGFLRVGLADPLPERKYYRRGWVSFKRDVNIKEICWDLNGIRVRDCDLGAIVNRDLIRRVRIVNGITAHRPVGQNDLRLAAKLVQIYDKRSGFWQDDVQNGEQEPKPLGENLIRMEYGIQSKNPLLQNLTDYLIEEASAEEDELLGTGGDSDTEHKIPFERDDELLKVLDRIILYLRLVHSVDYYNNGEYPHEDEMPNRCGLIHVRGPPNMENGVPTASQQFVTEFCKSFETKLGPLLNPFDKITDELSLKLGKKEPEKEVEAFITANCQELAKDKWLCPLSNKKFKGPEFVRKHILNKHNDKLDEVRTEVSYFNNYIYDPKRPGSEDPKPPLPGQTGHSAGTSGPSSYQSPAVGSSGGFEQGGGGFNAGGGRGPYHHPVDRSAPPPPLMGHSFDFRQGGGAPWRGGYGGHRGGDFHGPPRRDFNSGPRYGGRGGGNFDRSFDGGFRRRDPREPITYKDLDAPDDTY